MWHCALQQQWIGVEGPGRQQTRLHVAQIEFQDLLVFVASESEPTQPLGAAKHGEQRLSQCRSVLHLRHFRHQLLHQRQECVVIDHHATRSIGIRQGEAQSQAILCGRVRMRLRPGRDTTLSLISTCALWKRFRYHSETYEGLSENNVHSSMSCRVSIDHICDFIREIHCMHSFIQECGMTREIKNKNRTHTQRSTVSSEPDRAQPAYT